jgi:hypothetical protein
MPHARTRDDRRGALCEPVVVPSHRLKKPSGRGILRPSGINATEPLPAAAEPIGIAIDHASEGGSCTLKFSNIAPREFLQIEMISNLELPQIVSFRSKEGVAKLIKMAPLRLYSKPIIVTYLVLAGIGCATCLYVALRLVVPYVPWLQ